jgi:hypothetical protein
MANLIESIANLPLKKQQDILSSLTNKLVAIEVDDKVYLIPEEISDLIDGLSEQVLVLTDKLIWKAEE